MGDEVVKKAKMSEPSKDVVPLGSADEEEDLAPAFVSQYHVVKTILEYLNIGDICQAAVVNKQWEEISRIVRKQRKNLPFTMLIHPYLPHHKLAFEYFNGLQVSDEARDLVQSGSNGYFPFKPKAYPKQRFTGLLEDGKRVITETMRASYDEPQLIVNFGTSAFDTHLGVAHEAKIKASKPKKVSKERMKATIFEGVDNVIPCLSSFSCGVIASIPETGKNLELETHKFPCLSSLAIPKVQGLKTKLFVVTKEQNRALKGNETAERCKELLGILDEDEDQLKGIMLMHKVSHRVSSVVEAVLQYLRTKPDVALAGGVHETVLVSGTDDGDIIAAGMLIIGTENVKVSSIALQEDKISANNQLKLDKLKASLAPEDQSIAFMFACNGRGHHMHERPNVESDLFNSMFPKTPFIGAFTLGEYCHEKLPLSAEEKRVPPRRIDFAYTTVFLLLSYRHPIEDVKIV